MNHRPKQRFENMHQHHYRPTHHFGGAVPQQGPPPNVAQNRMPTASGGMRAQGMNPRPSHVPQQQQQQQQQPQQLQNQQVQQQHGGGVAVQQHPGYQHLTSQGHHSHPPTHMYYAAQAHQQHGAPPSYIQIPSYALSPTTNPGIPLQTISLQQVPRFAYYGAQPGQTQQTAHAYYQAANATPQHHQMYTTVPVHYAYQQQQHRMNAPTMHQNTHAVANTQQQLQQAPVVAQSHGVVSAMPAQHQPQQHHPQQQPVVSPQAQPIPRQEKAQERKKNILPILDPKTGRHVIDNSPTPAAPNSTPNAESGSAKGASTETAQNSLPSSGDTKQDSQNQVTPQIQEKQDLKLKDEAPEKVKDEGAAAPANDRNKSSAVRAEFFQKIAQASDDTRTTSSSSTGNTNANVETTGSSNQADADVPEAVVEPEVAVATASPPVPSTPTKDKSPSPEPSKQLVASTPVANTSSDDSKDASLVSISPTPIENYATPRSREVISSPSLQPTIEKYAEEAAEEEPTDVEDDGALPEEVPEPEITAEPVKHNDVEVEVEIEVEETTTTVVEAVQEEARADSALSDSVKQDESEKGDDGGIEDLGSASEENQPNGHLPLEEGELRDDDESTVADSGNDEQEDTTSSAKGKMKYDRNTLLAIGGRANIAEFKVAEHGLPDLAKDNLNNHIKSHPMAKSSPGGPRDYGRGPRGMPNQGNKGPMSPHQNMHMRIGGGGMGGMNWGGGIMIPPPPPGRVQPKVQITLQREEVKLHKAENAWKPATLKRGPTIQEKTDEETSVTDSIVKKTRGILNKLTPDNFDKLVSKFMALPLEDKDERISSVISVVFEKAIDEPSFSTAYAKMVQTVCKTSQETSKKFRKQILDQCQKEFQKSNTDEAEIKGVEQKLEEATDDDVRKQLKQEIEEKKFMSRRRSLGNVRFIGELYKLQMLTPKIMVECVQLLLYAPDDENLECLCKLLATVGQRLDMHLKSIEEQATRGENPKFRPEPKWMDKTVSMLQNLSQSKKLSSRIRFAILDVVELRQNDWKPRRDTNAPKTIEEVRQDAIRQEMEEKRQINSLPPVQNNYGGGGDRDHRSGGGGSRLPGGQPQKKGSEWSTLPANKASRFQNSAKKPEPSGSTGNPVFGPPSWGSNWGQRNQSGPPSSSQSKTPYPNLPPRLQANLANSNRFSNLAQDDGPRQQPNKSMQNSSDMGNFREPLPPMYPPHPAPPLIIASPTPSNNSSAENSRPVSPKDETVTADTGESVKNIFQEYLSCKKFDDTLHWIKKRFPGNKIDDFIDEISRQVGELSKEEEQKCAGSLVRLLIKNNQIPKEAVIRLMAQGVMQDLPDILIDSPMATSYLAQFLVEVFAEDKNLDWLVQVGDNLIDSDEGDSAWRLLAVNSLNLLKLRKNEEFVQTSFRQTERKNVIPIDEIPWLQDKPIDTLAEQMVKVLSPKVTSESSDEIGQIFQEHSWDVREEATARALTEAICTLTWNSETGNWNDEKLKKLLPLLGLPNKSMLPAVWKQVEEYARRKSIKKDECEGLWNIMYSLNMTTTTD